jgi:hypothetical protein
MMTRTSQRWSTRPGSIDTTKADRVFSSSNPYGIPDMQHTPLQSVPKWLAPYRTRIRSAQLPDDGAVHFFLDDYRFESCWSHPLKALRYLADFRTVLTPDFSLYADMPLAVQIWNTYRNRWLGCYWQSLGYSVIPTVSWSTPNSLDFSLCGIPTRSLVALSTVGIREPLAQYHFDIGYRAMLNQLRPSRVLIYGRLTEDLAELCSTIAYPTRWDNIRKARHGRSR